MYITLVLEQADIKFLIRTVKFRDKKIVVNRDIILKEDKFMYCGSVFSCLIIHGQIYSVYDFKILRKKLEDM